MKAIQYIKWKILGLRYKYRNCENCPASHVGYESHDFDCCEIYGDDFRYEECRYIWFPYKAIERVAKKIRDEEIARWEYIYENEINRIRTEE